MSVSRSSSGSPASFNPAQNASAPPSINPLFGCGGSDSVRFGAGEKSEKAAKFSPVEGAKGFFSRYIAGIKAHFGDKKALYPLKLLTLLVVLPKIFFDALQGGKGKSEKAPETA